MNRISRRDYLRSIYPPHRQASPSEKRRIIEEFCGNCDYHRKVCHPVAERLCARVPTASVAAASGLHLWTEVDLHLEGRLGSRRLSPVHALEAINGLYRNELRLFQNLFLPGSTC
jgi:hypothetical protein